MLGNILDAFTRHDITYLMLTVTNELSIFEFITLFTLQFFFTLRLEMTTSSPVHHFYIVTKVSHLLLLIYLQIRDRRNSFCLFVISFEFVPHCLDLLANCSIFQFQFFQSLMRFYILATIASAGLQVELGYKWHMLLFLISDILYRHAFFLASYYVYYIYWG